MSELAPEPINISTLTWEDRVFFAARGARVQGVVELVLTGTTDVVSQWEIHHSGEDLLNNILEEADNTWGLELEEGGAERLLMEACDAYKESKADEQT